MEQFATVCKRSMSLECSASVPSVVSIPTEVSCTQLIENEIFALRRFAYPLLLYLGSFRQAREPGPTLHVTRDGSRDPAEPRR